MVTMIRFAKLLGIIKWDMATSRMFAMINTSTMKFHGQVHDFPLEPA